MNHIPRIKLAGLASVLLIAFGASQNAHAAYWTDGKGQVVKNSYGECWVDRWGGEEPTPECGADSKPDAGPIDSDGDGVTDIKDRCPGTPAGVPVDKVGCPLDSDSDGVTDDKDRCPGTMMGARVDKHGCRHAAAKAAPPSRPVAKAPMVLKGVNFEFDSAILTAKAKGILDGVAKTLKAQSGQRITITGHTDSRGDDSYNQQLSKQRAQAVVDYLSSQGLTRSNLTAIGYGEDRPIDSNDTEAGRAANRRVELHTK